MVEIREIEGYEGLYGVAADGSVYSLITNRTRRKGKLKDYENTNGYRRVNLYKNGEVKHYYVHRLVAVAFVPNPEGLPVVNHINADPSDNRAENLEWCTQAENVAHSRSLGNQNKDTPVQATLPDGSVRNYPNIKSASLDLFGRSYLLNYHHQRQGDRFKYNGIHFEVKNGI